MLSDVIEKWCGHSETPMEMYRDIFHLDDGYIQKEWEPPGLFKTNPLIIGYSDGRMHRKILFEDTFQDVLEEFCEYDWAFMSGCSYFGRTNSAERQSKLYALIFDLDNVDESNLNNFFSGAFLAEAYPVPNHVVLSGSGVHLYYVLEEPVDLYPNIKTQVKDLKYALTRQMWNRYTSGEKDVQYQGINQAFRVPGSKTKKGSSIARCAAYCITRCPTSIEELNRYVDKKFQVDMGDRYKPTKISIAEVRKMYPEWYQRVVLEKKRSQWIAHPALYDWWLNVAFRATYGHRYFFVMCLAIYAAKCGIYDREKVKADAMKLIPRFTDLNPKHPFTEADIDSALECLDSRYVTFPRADIAKLSDIDIPQNKRNGRKRSDHLKIARFARDLNYEDGGWYNKDGAPKKRDLVCNYAAAHPNASQREIAKALCVSKTTVNKWLRDHKG